MERRAALAVGISILVLYLYQVFIIGPATPPPPDQSTATSSAQPAPAPAASAPEETPAGSSPEPAPEIPAPAAVTAAADEQTIRIDTGKVEAVITNRGGRILSWRLTEHLDEKGGPIDLIPSGLPDEPKPFSLVLPDAASSSRANTALYQVTGDASGRLDATGETRTLVLAYEDASGLAVRKEFTFEPDSYIFTARVDVTQNGARVPATIQWGPGLGDLGAGSAGGSFFTGNYVQPPEAIFHRDGDVTRVLPDDLAESPVQEGPFVFAGVDDHYFVAALLEPGDARLEYRRLAVGSEDAQRTFVAHAITPAGEPRPLRFYVGPKQLETLRAAGLDGQLAYTIHFGIFTWLVIPLLQSLKWLHGIVANWGWAIIILTIFINLVMFPFRHKSLVSMRKMQAIQPQVKAIQERYADLKMTDPARQKMNTEVMNLYREKGVNPASGCVPMLVTMPVLFAFYSMLSQAIELRGADFGLWIHDLSMQDPYYVTPVLMGVTMFWQQWVTPTSADPMQQRMMMFMPLFLTAIFLSLPSGLAIYYLVSNLCQIGQQYITNRTIPAVAPVQGAPTSAARRLKSAGGGKSQGASGTK
jgi:YidC/Oxa1 family membrane protein insertase